MPFTQSILHSQSRLTAGLLLQKLFNEEAIIVIDPQGTLYNFMLAKLVADGAFTHDPALKERVWFLDLPRAAQQGRYASLAMLDLGLDIRSTALVVVDGLHRAWPKLNTAPRFDTFVEHGCALLAHHNLPITLLTQVATSKVFREQLLKDVTDEDILSYFHDTYAGQEQRSYKDSDAVVNRISQLRFIPALRYSLDNNMPRTPDDTTSYNLANVLTTVFAQRKSLVVNLAFGDETTTRLWGSLLLAAVERASLARLTLPAEQQHPCTVLVDEFPLFVQQEKSETGLNVFLQRTLGSGLSMWLCHQGFSTVPPSVQGAIDTNCALRIAFRLGREDAEKMAPYFYDVDPLEVKHEDYDDDASHPIYYSVSEQEVGHRDKLMTLPFRTARLRQPNGWVNEFYTPEMPNPKVNEQELTNIQAYYLSTLFRSQDEIERDVAKRREELGVSPAQLAQLRKKGGDRQTDNTTNRAAADQSRRSSQTPPEQTAQPPETPRKSDATIGSDASPAPPPAEPSAQSNPPKDDDDEAAFKAAGRW